MDLLRHLRYLALLILILATYFSTVLARQHRVRHRHHQRHKRQHAATPARRPASFVVVGGGGPDEGNWGPWSEPSPCSRSCAGGVAYQQRRCQDVSIDGEALCRGGAKRYFSCNIQDCPERSSDFRAEQCAAFNDKPFEGRLLEWVPYTKAPNKCELNCMPRGERYYYRHKSKVVDGTRCDDEKLDICVDGECMPVGCDMMLGSPAREDLCRECGGDGSSCNTVRSIFENDLQVGYNDILLIPAGATNIVVREVKPSNNYLAIRNTTGHYYLNGNWRIDYPRSLRFAGTLFHYDRKHFLFYASESLTALGPTTEAIYVVLLYQETNPGIEYQYSISKGIAQQTDPDSYSWFSNDFPPCSATCGGGYQLRNVTCARHRDLKVVEDKLCNPVLEPERNKTCGTDPCPPAWAFGEWGACSASCGPGGSQMRQVFCEQVVSSGLPSIVDDQLCSEALGPRPVTTEPCNEDVACPTWFTGPWMPCDRLCGEGQHNRQVVCYHKVDGRIEVLEDSACQGDKPPDSKPCTLRPCEGVDWVYSDWSGCEDKCGLTSETRTAFCSNEAGKIYPDDRCYPYRLKELIRECENQMTCEFEWFASQWSECSADCGSGVQTRKVFCGTFDGETVKKVPDSKCDPEKRYEGLENCTGKETQCPGQWHAGLWSACSKPCGGGEMQRKVLCLIGNKSVEATKCDPNSILFVTEQCNAQACTEDGILPLEPGVTLSEEEECEDEEPYVILTTLGRGVTSLATEIGTKLEENATASATILSELSSATVHDVILSDSTWMSGSASEETFTSFETTLPDTLSTFHSTVDLSSIFTPLTTLSSGTTAASTESSSLLTTVTMSSVASTDLESTTSTGDETTESTSGNFTTSSQLFSLSSNYSSSLSSESSSALFNTSELTSDITTDGLSSSVSNMSSQYSDGTTVASNSTFETSVTTSPENTSYSFTQSLNDTSASLPTDNSSSFSTPSSDITSSTSYLNTTSSDLKSTVDVNSTTTALNSTTDLTSTTADLNSTTADFNSTTDLTSTTVDLNSTTADLNSTTTDLTPTTADLNSTTADLNSTTTDLTSTTADLNSTTADLNSTTTDLNSSTSHMTSPSSESTISSDSTSMFSSLSSLFTLTTESSASSLTTDTSVSGSSSIFTETDDGSGASDGDFTNEFSSTSLTGDITPSTEIFVNIIEYDGTNEITEGSGDDTDLPSTSWVATSDDLSRPFTAEVATSSSLSTLATTDNTTAVDATSGSSISTEASTTPSVMISSLSSSSVSEVSTSSGYSDSSAITSSSGVTSPSTLVTSSGTEQNTTSGESSSATTPSTDVTGTTTYSEGLTSYTTPSEVGTTGSSEEVSEEGDQLTTPSIAQTAFRVEQRTRKCKRRRVPKPRPTEGPCEASTFGCCLDNSTAATGPFGKGCPHPATCAETEHGCCPDEVSPAEGPDDLGCPPSLCELTLFGCCPDQVGTAQGNDYEGCEEPMLPLLCNQTEFGCCPDDIIPASGPDFEGCLDICEGSGDCALCNNTLFGCCPDGITPASGENFTGCDTDLYNVTTEPEETDCGNSTYGCCPDGLTVAVGPYFYGCEENCTDSFFGCCPDGVTQAKGSRNEGCRMPCNDERYGCCPDGETPAHGPNQEGCCLNTPHGCCPDNILPAQGPSLEGCGCLYSPYGCCPDNVTAARGSNNAGCGCQYTTNGCCPDAYTPAAGPHFQGCPCYTYQFGCCPDGVSIARGPHGEECGCQNMEYGCCSDGKTPASGPDGAGCGCEATKYGCCPDGETPAQGDNFEECLDSPIVPSVACMEPTDRGACREYKVKWFFDAEYGGCSRFWYGGCGGNGNRFNSQEECKSTCVEPSGRDACYLPKIPGPCKEYHPTWYYDSERKQCGQFIYGGCLGNNNKFQTREECEGLCVIPDTVDVCEQSRMEGPCRGNFTRWFYDSENGQCQHFTYGGCKGNGNNFYTETSCQERCLQRGKSRAYCFLPRTQGNCTENLSRWFFDPSENRCMPFYYSGCEGNGNRFETEEDCQRDCPPKVEQDTCLLPAMVGECYNYTEKWYYDSFEMRCRTFYYGGCGGNHNNFPSMEGCQQRCEPGYSTPTPPQKFLPEHCLKEHDQGPCSESVPQWFYDKADGVCKQFIYGGCQGNENRFSQRQECAEKCRNAQDICMLPREVGPCGGRQSNWYYDPASDTCREFEYGGCQGNANRFADRQACEDRCGKSRVTTTTTQPTPRVPVTPYPVLEPSDICLAPVVRGPCTEEQPAWYFDGYSRTCQAFIYSGCGGNANRFASEEQCERQCGDYIGKDVCSIPYEVGPCRGAFPKWYYDPLSKSCQQFIYGGCSGNGNRFSSVSECELVCLHREEPRPSINNTDETVQAVCSLPVDIGPCNESYYKRWYFNGDHRTCLPFLYSGCGGNLNRFKNFQSCEEYCSVLLVDEFGSGEPELSPNEIDLGARPGKESDLCEAAAQECGQLRCPYRIDKFMDGECTRCQCHDPCRDSRCPESTQCSVDLISNPETAETEFRAVCRQVSKPGYCPRLTPGAGTCHRECETDADCAAELKCCFNGCGSSCISPFAPPEQQILTTHPPRFPDEQTYRPLTNDVPASITSPETDLSAEEGGAIAMHCVASGYPAPTIIWRKGRLTITDTGGRHKIFSDGRLQITAVKRSDAGSYTCFANNGVGQPAQQDFSLEVKDPVTRPAEIIGEDNMFTVVKLGGPTILPCNAIGWPQPSVTWFHNSNMLPRGSQQYEIRPDFSLHIRTVTLSSLGPYTCQAYNGKGRAASWTVTLKAVGPVHVDDRDEAFVQYIVPPPERPPALRPTPRQPEYPYRPTQPPHRRPGRHRTRRPRPRHRTTTTTTTTTMPALTTLPPPALTSVPDSPRVYRVPVKTNVTMTQTLFPVGSSVSIPCDVDGYPIPTVTWYKDDVPLQSNERLQITEGNRLIIQQANSSDTGTYRCEAVNDFDKSASATSIVVEGIYIHPNCTDNPFFANCRLIVEARYCMHKYYARFCCRSCTITGQLPSFGPHLRKSGTIITSSLQDSTR